MDEETILALLIANTGKGGMIVVGPREALDLYTLLPVGRVLRAEPRFVLPPTPGLRYDPETDLFDHDVLSYDAPMKTMRASIMSVPLLPSPVYAGPKWAEPEVEYRVPRGKRRGPVPEAFAPRPPKGRRR